MFSNELLLFLLYFCLMKKVIKIELILNLIRLTPWVEGFFCKIEKNTSKIF